MEMPSIGSTVIALLEDDEVVRSAVTLLLESRGFHVVSGSSGSELAALIAATGTQPTLIIADYRLGLKTVIEELPEVVAITGSNAGVIVTTGDTSLETRTLIEAYGWRLLIKPYRPEELLSYIGGNSAGPV